MAVPILVLTPNPGFGELICQILEEAGRYTLVLTTNSKDAKAVNAKEKPILCIVDGDLKEDIPALMEELKQEVSELLVVFIPQDETTEEDEAKVKADGYLAKPFYLPDLVTTVQEVVDKSKSNVKDIDQVRAGPLTKKGLEEKEGLVEKDNMVGAGEKVDGPDWLIDVDVAAQHLTRLSLESSSQASLITRFGKVWAYAGELPQPAVDELAGTVAQFYSTDSKSDLARFIHLDATGGDYMLYATGIEDDFVLALVFDAEMPFSKIRSQASSLAKALSEAPKTNPSVVEPEKKGEDKLEEQSQLEPIEIMDLLEDVPPPIPNDWMPQEEVTEERKSFLEELMENDILADSPVAQNFTTKPNPSSQVQVETSEVELALDEDEYGPVEEIVESEHSSHQTSETMVSASLDRQDHHTAETLPSVNLEDSKEYKLEPVSPSVYNLTYACVLIPRLPTHHLTANVATNLSEWVTQLCLAFGWRLEHLSIRPEYLQWMVNVPPTTSPGYLMRIIRQHTSRRMFVEFPKIVDENPSGDFWAPGYLIMSGNQPPPPQLVKDFIQDTRRRQGVTR